MPGTTNYEQPSFWRGQDALQWEQHAANLRSYENMANHLLDSIQEVRDLDKIQDMYDIAARSGIFTQQALRRVPHLQVKALESNEDHLRMAKIKFSQTSAEGLFDSIDKLRDGHPYPPLIAELADMVDLREHLTVTRKMLEEHFMDVTFSHGGPHKVNELGDGAGLIVAWQNAHWWRRAPPEGVTKDDYPALVINNAYEALDDNGIFALSLTGHDYEFGDEKMDKKHMKQRQFYKHLMIAANAEAGKKLEEGCPYTYQKGELEDLLSHDFNIVRRDTTELRYNPAQLLEVYLLSALGPLKDSGMDQDEIEVALRNALLRTMQTTTFPREGIETSMQIVATKR